MAVGTPRGWRNLDKIDRGFVFIFVRSNNPAWLPAILLSLKSQFPESTVFLGNDLPMTASWFPSVPEDLIDLYRTVKADCPKGESHIVLKHDARGGERLRRS